MLAYRTTAKSRGGFGKMIYVDPVTGEIERFNHPGVLDPKRLRVTSSITTTPASMIDLFKRCATARLTIPLEIPDSIEHGLYLDTDVVVQQDIAGLYNLLDVFNSTQWGSLAWEEDPPCHAKEGLDPGRGPDEPGEQGCRGYGAYYIGNLKIPWYRPFGLNSGLFLFNLTRWKATPFSSWLETFEGYKSNADQDILNAWFELHREQMYRMPPCWNFRTHHKMHGCDLPHWYVHFGLCSGHLPVRSALRLTMDETLGGGPFLRVVFIVC